MIGSFGYYKGSSTSLRLGKVWILQFLYLAKSLGKAFRSLDEVSVFKIIYDKEVLLVINKIDNSPANEDLKKYLNSFKLNSSNKGGKRMFSTYNYYSDSCTRFSAIIRQNSGFIPDISKFEPGCSRHFLTEVLLRVRKYSSLCLAPDQSLKLKFFLQNEKYFR